MAVSSIESITLRKHHTDRVSSQMLMTGGKKTAENLTVLDADWLQAHSINDTGYKSL